MQVGSSIIAKICPLLPKDGIIEIYEIEAEAYVLHQKARTFTYTLTIEDCGITINFNEIWQLSKQMPQVP